MYDYTTLITDRTRDASGTPSKTSASFSINADGTLNGLPSDLQAVDLLVTIGV